MGDGSNEDWTRPRLLPTPFLQRTIAWVLPNCFCRGRGNQGSDVTDCAKEVQGSFQQSQGMGREKVFPWREHFTQTLGSNPISLWGYRQLQKMLVSHIWGAHTFGKQFPCVLFSCLPSAMSWERSEAEQPAPQPAFIFNVALIDSVSVCNSTMPVPSFLN